MSDVYVVWHNGGVDVVESKEQAFGRYRYMQDSDDYWYYSVEGPGGVDLTDEANRYVDECDQRAAEARKSGPRTLGSIELRHNDGDWSTAHWIYEGNQYGYNAEGQWGLYGEPYGEFKDRMMAKYTAALGPERVRFTPVK